MRMGGVGPQRTPKSGVRALAAQFTGVISQSLRNGERLLGSIIPAPLHAAGGANPRRLVTCSGACKRGGEGRRERLGLGPEPSPVPQATSVGY